MQIYNIFSASFHLFVFLYVLPHSTDFKSNLIQCFAVVFTNFIYFYSVFSYSAFSSYSSSSTSSTLSFSIYLSSSVTLSHTIIFLLPSCLLTIVALLSKYNKILNSVLFSSCDILAFFSFSFSYASILVWRVLFFYSSLLFSSCHLSLCLFLSNHSMAFLHSSYCSS